MKILGIESASLVASVAVVTDGLVTAEYTVDFKKTHSQTLLPMIDEVTRMLELDLHEVDAIAVSGGPGSYTGLRIRLCNSKGPGPGIGKSRWCTYRPWMPWHTIYMEPLPSSAPSWTREEDRFIRDSIIMKRILRS